MNSIAISTHARQQVLATTGISGISFISGLITEYTPASAILLQVWPPTQPQAYPKGVTPIEGIL
ncbi:MAG: hypothetical protein ACPG4Q_14535, partial [Phycisphaeraceae bacterium]